MSIQPCGHRLTVKPYKQEELDDVTKSAKAAGLIVINENAKREDASVDRGFVLAIGPTAWKDFNSEPWCKVGDEVLFAKFAGKIVTDPETQQDVFILNDEDIVAVVKESK